MNTHLSAIWVTVLIVLAIWELAWKGAALWRAGQRRQLQWFVAILVLNTVGVLPIIYLSLNKGEGK